MSTVDPVSLSWSNGGRVGYGWLVHQQGQPVCTVCGDRADQIAVRGLGLILAAPTMLSALKCVKVSFDHLARLMDGVLDCPPFDDTRRMIEEAIAEAETVQV